ncbi:macrolide transporter subunit MacA [Chromobacterium violaceum]|uniref:Macrolide transporter subunit MacA n=3 Tax=Chromobacterium violaceum TaxID=536 RepID=A0A202B5D6_CHRVL|nr:macrolide transporter subunit MacA [Chromobacterium violaceum]
MLAMMRLRQWFGIFLLPARGLAALWRRFRRRGFGKRPWRNAMALLAVLALAVWGAHRGLAEDPPPAVLTAKVERGELEDLVLASGMIQALRQVDVGAQTNGQLKSLKVEAGDKVKQGQLLAEIDPEDSLNALRAAEASLDARIAQRQAKQASLRQAEQELARQRRMHAEGSTSDKDLLAADTSYRTLKAGLAELQAQIRQDESQRDSKRTLLGYTRILAPMDGEVLEIVTQQGQTVIATQTAPVILKLADLSKVTVRADVAEADVIRIQAGLPVYFTVLGAPDKRYWGKLRAILPMPEKINNAMFYKALFDVPNPDGKLRVNMTTQVSIVLSRVDKALSIPLSALGAAGKDGRHAVKVKGKDGRLQERRVRIGLKTSTRVQVLDGLKAGEQVVTGEQGDKPEEGGAVVIGA